MPWPLGLLRGGSTDSKGVSSAKKNVGEDREAARTTEGKKVIEAITRGGKRVRYSGTGAAAGGGAEKAVAEDKKAVDAAEVGNRAAT